MTTQKNSLSVTLFFVLLPVVLFTTMIVSFLLIAKPVEENRVMTITKDHKSSVQSLEVGR